MGALQHVSVPSPPRVTSISVLQDEQTYRLRTSFAMDFSIQCLQLDLRAQLRPHQFAERVPG